LSSPGLPQAVQLAVADSEPGQLGTGQETLLPRRRDRQLVVPLMRHAPSVASAAAHGTQGVVDGALDAGLGRLAPQLRRLRGDAQGGSTEKLRPVQYHRARDRGECPDDRREQGRLARPVRPCHQDQFARGGREADLMKDSQVAVAGSAASVTHLVGGSY
jgi:hypothetical protein